MPVDLSGAVFASYEKTRKRADQLLRDGAYDRAATAYERCAALLQQYAATSTDMRTRLRWEKQASELRALAEKTRTKTFVEQNTEMPGIDTPDAYRGIAAGWIDRSQVTWDDIGGLEGTIHEIKTAYALSLARKPEGVRSQSARNFLFYGPPGTGKTLIAAAVSNGLDATFFNVKAGQLTSKHFGDSQKLITALFEEARDRAPSVVFIDEFESLAAARDDSDSGAERRIVGALLESLDGFDSKDDDRYVLTIVATNLPHLMDKAILSRMDKTIYIPLPDAAARAAILDIHLRERGYRVEVPVADLVAHTDGYSGRDLRKLCTEAISHMETRVNPEMVPLVDKGQRAMRNYELRIEPVNATDFDYAFGKVKPEATQQDLMVFERWRTGMD